MPQYPRSKIDDDALTSRAQAGDGIAFSALVERHYVRVVLIAEAVAGSLPLAEICAQEAFARACGRLGEIADPAAFRALVYRTALARALVRRPLGQTERAALRAQAVLALREHGGLGYAEMAAMLGLSQAAVRRLLTGARTRACDPLSARGAPPAPSAWRQG